MKIEKHKLSALYEISSGISSKKEQAGHGYPFVSFSTVFNNYFIPEYLPDLMNTSEKDQLTYSIKEGDVLITRTSETIDELAMSCVALKDFPNTTYSGFTKRLRPKKSGVAYPKYMAFYLRNELFRKTVTNNAFMTLRASFNEDIFSFLNVYLPPYADQVKIGDFLYKIERKIQINKETINELEAISKLIYDYWFVQFDFPDERGRPYKSSGGKMQWSEVLCKEVPLNWKLMELKEILCINNITINPVVLKDEIVEHYSIPAYDASRFPVFQKAYSIASNKYKVSPYNILYSKLNPVFKRIWDPYCFTENAVCSTELIPFECNDINDRPFCYALLNSDEFYQFACQNASSSTGSRKRLAPEDTLNYSFVMPLDKYILEKFVQLYKPIMDKNKKLHNEIFELSNMRDWLVPMFVSGQLIMNDTMFE